MKKLTTTILLFVFPLICFAQNTETKASLQHKKVPLYLTIKSDKDVYEIGEKIDINIGLKNIDTKPVTVLILPFPSFPTEYDFHIMDPDQGLVHCDCLHTVDAVPQQKHFIMFKPGESYETHTTVISSCCEMEEIGIYTITLIPTFDNTYYDIFAERFLKLKSAWTGQLTSNIITVELTKEK